MPLFWRDVHRSMQAAFGTTESGGFSSIAVQDNTAEEHNATAQGRTASPHAGPVTLVQWEIGITA